MSCYSSADGPNCNPRLIAMNEGPTPVELGPAPPTRIADPKPKRDFEAFPSISTDGSVVLDLEHDRLLKLNPVGAVMWKMLAAGNSESFIIESIARQYQVDSQRVASDFHALLAQIAELGIEIRTEPTREHEATSSDLPSFPWYGQDASAPRPQPSRATVCFAVLGLALVDLILWITSIKSLCLAVKGWPLRKRNISDPTTVVGRICGAVEIGSVWYPRRTLCLQRSAVTTCLLRCHGIPAHMIIGARPMPFLSHAWVETNGRVINDWPRVKNVYQVLASY